MSLDSTWAQVQNTGDILVRLAFGQKLQDFLFSFRKEIVGIMQPTLLHLPHVIFEQCVCNCRTEVGLALSHNADRAFQIDFRIFFEQVTFGAGSKSPYQICLIGMHAEHDDSDLWILFDDLSGGLDTIQIRHRNIHNDDFRCKFIGHRDRFASVTGFTHYLEVAVLLELKP